MSGVLRSTCASQGEFPVESEGRWKEGEVGV